MACCARAAPALLLHANVLLVIYVGALLMLGARLTWDPSLYVAARTLAPTEFSVARLAAPLLAGALMLGAHVAAAATLARRPAARRALLLLYALWMTCVWACQLAALGWAWSRGAPLLRDGTAAQLQRVAADVRALLALLARYHPLPEELRPLFEEVWADLPRNAYVAGAALAFLLLLQPAAAVAALVARAAVPAAARRKPGALLSSDSMSSSDSPGSERRARRTVYRGGKLALV